MEQTKKEEKIDVSHGQQVPNTQQIFNQTISQNVLVISDSLTITPPKIELNVGISYTCFMGIIFPLIYLQFNWESQPKIEWKCKV